MADTAGSREVGTTFRLSHMTSHILFAALFVNVKNSAFLRQQLISANADYEYAFLDATSVLSVRQVLAAAFRAVNDSVNGRLKSRNVHSETVFALSPNNNIAESFRRFGISDATTSLIAVKIIPTNGTEDDQVASVAAVSNHLKASIEGDPLLVTESNLAVLSDVPKICKIYKVENKTTPNGLSSTAGRIGKIEGTILGIMAIKGS